MSLLSFSLGKCQNRQKCHGLIFEYSPCFSLRNRVPILSLKSLKCPLLHPVLLGYLYGLGCRKGRRQQIDYHLLLAVKGILIQDICTLNADSLKYSVSLMALSTVNRSKQALSHSPQVHRASWIIRQKRMMYISNLPNRYSRWCRSFPGRTTQRNGAATRKAVSWHLLAKRICGSISPCSLRLHSDYQFGNDVIPTLALYLPEALCVPPCFLLPGWASQTRMRSDKPVGAFTFANSFKIFFWIVPMTDIYGRLMKMELLAFFRSDMVVLALNTESQNCSSEPLL